MMENSFEFADTAEDKRLERAALWPARLSVLQREVGQVAVWLQDALRDDPQNERARLIRIAVASADVQLARSLWLEQQASFPNSMLPAPYDHQWNDNFGQGLAAYDRFLEFVGNDALPGLAEQVWEAEGPSIAQQMRAREEELRAQGQDEEADKVASVRVSLDSQHLLYDSYFALRKEEAEAQWKIADAKRARRVPVDPPSASFGGAPGRVPVPAKVPFAGGAKRVPARDEQGRFSSSVTDKDT